MATAGRVNVNATMDTAKFEAGVRRISRGVKSMQATTTKSLYHIQKAQKAVTAGWTLMRAAAGAFVAGYGVRLVRQALDVADNIGKVADKVGISTKALQELQFAAKQTGVPINTLNMALQRFSRRLGEAAQGKGELVGVLRQYGIKVTDATGRTRAMEDVLGDLAEVIKNAGSSSEQLRIAFKAFDSEGAALVNTLRNGRAGLNGYAAQAKRLGIILDEDLIRNAEEARSKLDALGQVIGLKLTKFVADNADKLIAMADALLDVGEAATTAWEKLFGGVDERSLKRIQSYRKEIQEIDKALRTGVTEKPSLLTALLPEGSVLRLRSVGKDERAQLKERREKLIQYLAEEKEKLGMVPPFVFEVPTQVKVQGAVNLPTQAQAAIDSIIDRIRMPDQPLEFGQESWDRALFGNLPAEIDNVKSSLDRADLFEGFRLDAQETTAAFEMMNLQIVGSTQVMAEESQAATREMSEFAIQAARSIQSSFADLLFDPFGSSLEDMLLKWTETLRRMAAEAAAAAILEALFPATAAGGGLGGFLSGLMGRQHGGHVSRGKPYWVGEAGKELFVPAQSGTVVPSGKMGGVNISYNIDARGATKDLAERLPGILEAERRRTVYEVSELMRRGRM